MSYRITISIQKVLASTALGRHRAFVNAYIVSKHFLVHGKTGTVLELRLKVISGLPNFSIQRTRRSGSITSRKRRYNLSLPDSVRLGNKGGHWPLFSER